MVATAARKKRVRPGERRVELLPGIYIDVPNAPWSEKEKRAWYWPEPMLPSEWAERYRVLEKSAIPGPWQNRNAPYLVGIMDLCVKRGVERLIIKKAAQVGGSEGLRNVLGYWAHMDPAPMGLALPNKEKGREIVENEFMPLFRETFAKHPELKGLMSTRMHDIKKGQIKLANPFLMHLMWSGSPASMASNPMKRAICDEVNKFEAWAGNDADPVSLITARMRTFPDSLLIEISTPTDATGAISTDFEACSYQFFFLVACPHCHSRQRLLFGEGGDYGVKWSEEVRQLRKEGRHEAAAALVMLPGPPTHCWYQCCSCHGKIDERQKRAIVRAGKWGTVGKDGILGNAIEDGGTPDAMALEEFPPGSWVGLQIGSQYCCWDSWTLAHMAAQFLRARALSQRFYFRTSTLGENWEEAAETVDVVSIDDRVKQATLEEGVLPPWTARLLATVDTQKDHFWLVIRAWGPGRRSQRIWHGKVSSFEEIEQWCFKTPWPSEDPRLPAWMVDKIAIDSGGTRKHQLEEENADAPLPSRVMDVYAWALDHAAHVDVIKGDARPEAGTYLRRGRGQYVNDGGGAKIIKPVPIWLLDVHHFHDELQDLMTTSTEDLDVKTGEILGKSPLWALNKRHDPEYHHHLANMHKVSERSGRGGQLALKWRPVREGVRVDYRACECYQVALAYLTGVHQLPDMPTWLEFVEAQIAGRDAASKQRGQQGSGFTTPDGRPFLATRRER